MSALEVKLPFGNDVVYEVGAYGNLMEEEMRKILLRDAQDFLGRQGFRGRLDLINFMYKRRNVVFFQSALAGAGAGDSLLTVRVGEEEAHHQLTVIHVPSRTSFPLCWRKGTDGNCERVPVAADLSCGGHGKEGMGFIPQYVDHTMQRRGSQKIFDSALADFMGDGEKIIKSSVKIAVTALGARISQQIGVGWKGEMSEGLFRGIRQSLGVRVFSYGHVCLSYNRLADSFLMRFGSDGAWTGLCSSTNCLKTRRSPSSITCKIHGEGGDGKYRDKNEQVIATLLEALGIANRAELSEERLARLLFEMNGGGGGAKRIVAKDFQDASVTLSRELMEEQQYLVAKWTPKKGECVRFIFCDNLLAGCFALSGATIRSCPSCNPKDDYVVRVYRAERRYMIIRTRVRRLMTEDAEFNRLIAKMAEWRALKRELVFVYRGCKGKEDSGSLMTSLRLMLYIEAVCWGEAIDVDEGMAEIGSRVFHYLGWLLEQAGMNLLSDSGVMNRVLRKPDGKLLYEDMDREEPIANVARIYEGRNVRTGKVYVGSTRVSGKGAAAAYHYLGAEDNSNYHLLWEEEGGLEDEIVNRVIGELVTKPGHANQTASARQLENAESLLMLTRVLGAEGRMDGGPSLVLNAKFPRLGGLGANDFLYYLCKSMLFAYKRTFSWELGSEPKRYLLDRSRASHGSRCYD